MKPVSEQQKQRRINDQYCLRAVVRALRVSLAEIEPLTYVAQHPPQAAETVRALAKLVESLEQLV